MGIFKDLRDNRTPGTESRRRCGRCRMQFRTAAPASGAGVEFEILRCPDCDRRFWSDPHGGVGGRCAVGLLPEQRA